MFKGEALGHAGATFHTCTPTMVKEMREFLEGLGSPRETTRFKLFTGD